MNYKARRYRRAFLWLELLPRLKKIFEPQHIILLFLNKYDIILKRIVRFDLEVRYGSRLFKIMEITN